MSHTGTAGLPEPQASPRAYREGKGARHAASERYIGPFSGETQVAPAGAACPREWGQIGLSL